MNKKSHKKSHYKNPKVVTEIDNAFAESLENKLNNITAKKEEFINRPITDQKETERINRSREEKQKFLTEEERLVILDRYQRLGEDDVKEYIQYYNISLEELKKPIKSSESIESIEEKSDINEKFVKNIVKDSKKRGLPIVDRNVKSLRGVDVNIAAKEERKNNPMSKEENGIIKVKRPFYVTPINKPIARKEDPDLNSAASKTIKENYGQDNYIQSLSIFNNIYNAPHSQIDIGIPDINVKILDSESQEAMDAVKEGKGYYEKNKGEMQQQMNVVAFYSIKDAKPFYYVSSAEARLAIEHINLCRKYKKDIFKINTETISKYVPDIMNIIKQLKEENPAGDSISTIWKNCYENTIVADDDYDSVVEKDIARYTNIKNITKQVFISRKIDGNIIGLQKFNVVADSIDCGSIKSVINLNESLTLFGQCSHYIVFNKWYADILSVNSLLDVPNITEREIFGIIGKYNKKPVFINENMPKNSYVILSRRIDDGNIMISEYEINKADIKFDKE